MTLGALRGWTSEQKHVVAASFLGWMLDAFDFFLLVFVLSDVAKTFAVPVAPKPLVLDAHYLAATHRIPREGRDPRCPRCGTASSARSPDRPGWMRRSF